MDEIKKLIDEIFNTLKMLQGRGDKNSAAVAELQARHDELTKQLVNLELGGGHVPGAPNGQPRAYEVFNSILRERHGPQAGQLNAAGLRDYERALDTYLRLGQAALDRTDIRNLLSVGSDPAGGFTVLPNLNPVPREKLFGANPMRALARTVTITQGDSYEELADDGEFGAGYVGETDPRTETDAGTLAKLVSYVREPYVLVPLTNKLIDLSSIDMVGYVRDRGEKKFRRLENRDFVSGNGITRPRGFLDHASNATTQSDEGTDPRPINKLQYVASGQAGAFPKVSGLTNADDPSCLFRLRASLNAELRPGAVWVMNSNTEASLMSLRDNEGRWLFQQSIIPDAPNRLLGAPIIIMESMPDIASDSHCIAYGNFMDGYLIVDVPGVRVLRDPYTTKGRTSIYMYKYVGGEVWNYSAIKLLRMSAS